MAPDPVLTMVTPERLTGILRRAGVLADGHVRDVVVASTRDTILSRIIRLRLSHDGAPDAPRTLILKTAQPVRKDVGGEEGAQQEVAFYNQIAPAMTAAPVPRCFEAHWDPNTKTWHILLEDLGESHVVPTVWPMPPTMAQCESIIGARARFHAAWWNDARLGVSIGIRPGHAAFDQYLKRFTAAFGRFDGQVVDRLTRDRRELFSRYMDNLPRLAARRRAAGTTTIIHGDGHVWNCFLPSDGKSDDVRLFDWDAWRLGLGSDDLAYMMAVHWYPHMRHEREVSLLDHYHATLTARGVKGYDRRSLDEDYRLSVLWQLMTPVWQAWYNIPPVIWWNNLERVLLAVDDLDCRDLLA